MSGNTDVVVIGGGYAGVMAANRLTRRDDVTVTMINPRAEFVDRIRLHQYLTGSHRAVTGFEKMLSEPVHLRVGTATSIDAPSRLVALADGAEIGYDHLIYALGSRSADLDVPGAAEHALPLSTLEDAETLRRALDSAPSDARVTVVGSGPTGIEIAAELAEHGRDVTLVCGETLGPYLHPRGRRYVRERLERLGARVLEGPSAQAVAVTDRAVQLADGREVAGAVAVWTAGFSVPDLAARSGLATDEAGRLLTEETLTSVDDEHIVAAGDAASPSGLPYRMSCQAATQLGPSSAETVLSRIAGKQPAPVAVGFVGQCISLGRRTGIVQFAGRDDVPAPRALTGRPGAWLKELVSAGVPWSLALEARRPGIVSYPRWIGDPRRRQKLLRAASDPVART